MEPVYEHIEFCRRPQTLWGKLKEGRWDWLGVHPDGQYVLGSPRRRGVVGSHGSLTKHNAGAITGRHGVRTYTAPGFRPSEEWHTTAEQAQEAFQRDVAELQRKSVERPTLAYVQRIEDGAPIGEEWIVSRPPTYR